MAKSRRKTSDSQSKYRIITLGCSFTCIILNFSIACIYYFHPCPETFDNTVLTWASFPNVAFVVVLVFLTHVIHRYREHSMKWVFIVLCILLFLEILLACVTIVAYVMRSDKKISTLKSDMAIEEKFNCRFAKLKNSIARPGCTLVLKRYIRNRAVYLATILIIKFVFLGSEALMILFHYMNYLPT